MWRGGLCQHRLFGYTPRRFAMDTRARKHLFSLDDVSFEGETDETASKCARVGVLIWLNDTSNASFGRPMRGIIKALILVAILCGPQLSAAKPKKLPGQTVSGSPSSQQAGEHDSRAEEWRKLRRQKSRQKIQRKRSGLEKAFLKMESPKFREVLTIRYKNFYPKFGNLSHGSGFSPGLRYYKTNLGGSPLSIEASGAFSFTGYKLGSVVFGKFKQAAPYLFLGPIEFATPFRFSDEREKRSDYFLYVDARYRYFPGERFYGQGPDSRVEDRSDFLLEDGSYDLVTGYHYNRFGVAVRFGYLQTNTGEGTDDDFPSTESRFVETSLPGLEQQPAFLRLNSAVFLDYRDTPGNPHKGGLLGFSFTRFDNYGDEEFEFNRYSIDARGYIPLGSKQRVLALRFFASADESDPESQVPFYLQRTLGGNQTLRGFNQFRFRDDRLLYLSAEYRWEAWPAVEFVGFYDAGKVFPETEDFDFDGLEKSIGGGVRFKTSRRTVFRLDVGHSNEGTRVHFRFDPSF